MGIQAADDTIITKEWKIPRDLIPGVPPDPAKAPAGAGDSDNRKVDRETPKNWLIANGVTFEGAAAAVYIVRSSRLVVRNTQDQLDLVDAIINRVVGSPLLIEFECRLVEVEREKIKDVTFESIVREFNGPGTSKVFLGDTAVTKEASPNLFSEMTGGKDPKSGVFTDPQFQIVLRMLVQKKGADILNAPKITLKSGQPAVVRFIRQFSNPPEDVPPQVRSLIPLERAPSAAAGKVVSTTSPAYNEDRNIAVTLEVKPVVGPDGYTIDLNMAPQVTEFAGFASYTSPFRWMNPSFGPAGRIVTPQPMPPPIFSTRKVTTSVSVFDGSTVVFGDLLHGEGTTPVLGCSDRATDGRPAKRCLILFVTARLLSVGSSPVRADDEKEEVIEHIAAPEKALPLMPR
jgi:general secretion pathway protein D